MEKVRVASVIVQRDDADAIPPTTDSALDLDPIIVTSDMVLIDGLRRLKWFQANAYEDIPAIVVSTFPDACDAVRLQNAGVSQTIQRQWEIIKSLRILGEEWKRVNATGGWVWDKDGARRNPPKTNRNHRVYSPERSTPRRICAALGVSYHQYQAIRYIYSRAETGDERAIELVADIKAGKISAQKAFEKHHRPFGLGGPVTRQAEQTRILAGSITGLESHLSVLRKLGHPLKVTGSDLDSVISQLTDLRGELSAFIANLRRIKKEQESG